MPFGKKSRWAALLVAAISAFFIGVAGFVIVRGSAQRIAEPSSDDMPASDRAALNQLKAELREAEKDPEFDKATEKARASAAQNMKQLGQAILKYEEQRNAEGSANARANSGK